MKVVLSRQVPKLGQKGDIVEVSEGFARNYLFQRGLAVPQGGVAAAGVLREISLSQKLSTLRREQKSKARTTLAQHVFIFSRPASESGSLYAGITALELASEVSRFLKVPIDPKKITFPNPVKVLGPSSAVLKLDDEAIVLRLSVNESKPA